MIGDIDLTKSVQKPQLYLCKPNKNIVAKLNSAYGVVHKIKLGNVSELSFNLPYQIEQNYQLVDNPYIDLIRYNYLIKLTYDQNNYEEWFIIDRPIDNNEEDIDYKNITCFSLEIELKNKKIKNYSATSYNATQLFTDILEDTLWTIDYINSEFNNTYRSMEISLKSALDFIFEIANTFNAIPIFDTINRKISLYKEDEIGSDKGLKFSYGKYLKSLNKEINPEDFCTKLKCFGQNNISINEVNPTGYNYIFDYSYFLYPYDETITDEENDIYTVNSSSYYMSDELCHNILKYNKLLESKNGVEDVAEIGTTTTNIKMTAHGLTTGDWILNKTRYNEYRKVTVVDVDNITVSEITGQTNGDEILKYVDDTFRKLIFQKEEKQNELTTLNNELDTLETEKVIVLDNIGIQQENNTITSYDFTYDGSTTTKTTNLNDTYKYTVMCKVSSITDLTVKLDGVTKTLSDNTWSVLGKIASASSTAVEVSGTATGVNVKIVVVKITDTEYTTSDNEQDLIEKYNLDYKQTQIDSKNTEITNKQTEIDNIDTSISTINTELSFGNNFTSAQLDELKSYNKEEIYENSTISNAQDLYDVAIEEFNKKNSPQTIINIDIANFLQCVTEQREWDKLNLGDTVTINYELSKIDTNAKIVEIEFMHEDGDINLTIANIKDILSDKDIFIKKLYNSIYTTNNLNQKKIDWNIIATNFNMRNDRNSTTPADPVVANDGTAIDHTVNTDSSCDISFEWTYDGSGDAYDIDGFLIYIRASNSSESYIFGSSITKEQVYNIDFNKRGFILYGVPANQYYTFGIQAYRKVDTDINSEGILKSDIIKSTYTGENPYLPSANVAFTGDVTGTINSIASSTVVNNANNGLSAFNDTLKYRTIGMPTNNPSPTGIIITTNSNATVNIKVEWSAYTQGTNQADMLILFWKKGDSAPTVNDSAITFNVNTAAGSYYIFEGVNPADTYSFGLASARRTENGIEICTIQSPTSAPDWQGVTSGTPNYTANVGGTVASTLVSTANTALTNANSAQTSANTANALLVDIASDEKLTPVEKQDTKKEWDIIVVEKPTIEAQATTYGITTEKTNYINSYNTLSSYITPLLSDLTTTSDIVGTTFRTNFKDYYDKKVILLKAISDKAKQIADAAQTAANSAQTNLNTHGGLESPHNLPSYCKMQSDGFKVFDGSNNLRCHMGQYASGKYGVKITDGEIFSTKISTGAEGGPNRIQLDSTGFYLYGQDKKLVEIQASTVAAVRLYTYNSGTDNHQVSGLLQSILSYSMDGWGGNYAICVMGDVYDTLHGQGFVSRPIVLDPGSEAVVCRNDMAFSGGKGPVIKDDGGTWRRIRCNSSGTLYTQSVTPY